WSIIKKYRAIYSYEHWQEFARGLAKIKSEALAAIDEADDVKERSPSQFPPGAMISSAGIAAFYTIGHEDDKFVHQLSLSHEGYWFAEQAARVLVAYVHLLLGLEATPIALGFGGGRRYYMAFELEPDEQEAFISRPIQVPALETMPAIYKDCFERAQHLK